MKINKTRIKYLGLLCTLSILLGCADSGDTGKYKELLFGNSASSGGGSNGGGDISIGTEDQTQKDTSSSVIYFRCQSFVPSKNTLVAVKLFHKASPYNPGVYSIGIYSSTSTIFSNTPLTSIQVSLGSQNAGKWVLCDFPDISIIPGNVYYIGVSLSSGYVQEWGCSAYNVYSQGALMGYESSQWVAYSKDLAFITLTN